MEWKENILIEKSAFELIFFFFMMSLMEY